MSMMFRSSLFLLTALTACAGIAPSAWANVIYVDNLRGDDASDGTAPEALNIVSGPVRTLRRGLQLLQGGGTLNIANTGRPYYESMEVVGGQLLSGTPLRPTLIEGNGAELNGAYPVPPNAWRKVGERLWKFTPFRKGHYLLLLENHSIPETPVPAGSLKLPNLPDGHWAAWKGSIYYQAKPVDEPADFEMWYTVRSVGITFYEVHDILMRNLKVRHFRIDGVNAHDRCENVVLENITAEENGRAGVTAAGTSFVTLERCTIKDNRLYSVLIKEKAGVQIGEETEVTPKPTLTE